MKTRNAILVFAFGLLLGVSLAVGLGAVEKPPDKIVEPTKPDLSRLKLLGFATGITGFFDPDTGRLYLYDENLVRCTAIRELTALGEPMVRIRN